MPYTDIWLMSKKIKKMKNLQDKLIIRLKLHKNFNIINEVKFK